MTSHERRKLKAEDIGDSGRKQTIPSLRLKGKWLGRLGFKPGRRVEIIPQSPGELLLRDTA
jgi:hypothetical protein